MWRPSPSSALSRSATLASPASTHVPAPPAGPPPSRPSRPRPRGPGRRRRRSRSPAAAAAPPAGCTAAGTTCAAAATARAARSQNPAGSPAPPAWTHPVARPERPPRIARRKPPPPIPPHRRQVRSIHSLGLLYCCLAPKRCFAALKAALKTQTPRPQRWRAARGSHSKSAVIPAGARQRGEPGPSRRPLLPFPGRVRFAALRRTFGIPLIDRDYSARRLAGPWPPSRTRPRAPTAASSASWAAAPASPPATATP